MAENDNFFNRLTRLFRSGPLIKRKVKAERAPNMGTLLQQFQKSQSHVYANAISAYGMYDRMSRYADFQEMEATPEIASAMDIYADESASQDEVGRVLHIYSENDKIRRILEEPDNSLIKQYTALLGTENVSLEFAKDGIETIAKMATEINSTIENIGARRLYTIIEKVLDEVSFTATDRSGEKIIVDKNFVTKNLGELVKDTDLSKFIL